MANVPGILAIIWGATEAAGNAKKLVEGLRRNRRKVFDDAEHQALEELVGAYRRLLHATEDGSSAADIKDQWRDVSLLLRELALWSKKPSMTQACNQLQDAIDEAVSRKGKIARVRHDALLAAIEELLSAFRMA